MTGINKNFACVSTIIIWCLLLEFGSYVNAFTVNSFNGTSGGTTYAPQVTMLTTGTAVTGLLVRCDQTNLAGSSSVNTQPCIAWYADTFNFTSDSLQYPITPLLGMNETSTLPTDSFVDLAFIPLVGVSPTAMCSSFGQKRSNFISSDGFPCAVFVLGTRTPQQAWLVDVFTGRRTNVPSSLRPLPFDCSDQLPCEVRSPSARNGTVGGCGAAPASDTLVVVTWNNTRFIFRPLKYFTGIGRIYSAKSRALEWALAANVPFDISLQFHSITSSIQVDAKNVLSLLSVCVMHFVGVDGSTEMFDTDVDDANTTTGLSYIGAIPAAPSTGSASCIPFLQHVTYISYSQMYNGENSTLGVNRKDTLLSITCNTGEGWLWHFKVTGGQDPSQLLAEYELYPNPPGAQGPPFAVTLQTSGSFSLSPPPAARANAPLTVDIAIVALGAACDQTLIISSESVGLKYVMKVALLGVGILEEVAVSTNNAAQQVASFGTFLGDYETKNFTKLFVSAAVIAPELPITTGGSDGSASRSVEHAMMGMGWVVADQQPVATYFSNPLGLEEDFACDGNAAQMANWYASDGILYAAMTERHGVLINGSTGMLASQSSYINVFNVQSAVVGNNSYSVHGGVSASLFPLVGGDASIVSYQRAPRSPPFVSINNVGGSANLLLMRTSSCKVPLQPGCPNNSISLLTLPNRVLYIDAYITIDGQQTYSTESTMVGASSYSRGHRMDWDWSLVPMPESIFTPSAVATVIDLPRSNSSSLGLDVALVWGSSGSISSARCSEFATVFTTHTGTASFPRIQVASFDSTHPNATSTNGDAISAQPLLLYSTSNDLYIVCSGRSLYGYTGTIGNTSWTVLDLCINISEACMCTPENPLFISDFVVNDMQQTNYLFVTLLVPSKNATGMVVVDLLGTVVSSSFTLASEGLPIDCLTIDSPVSHSDDPKKYGDIAEVSNAINVVGIMMPIVGARCSVMVAWLEEWDHFIFVTFVHSGDRPAYDSSITFMNPLIVITTPPSWDSNIYWGAVYTVFN